MRHAQAHTLVLGFLACTYLSCGSESSNGSASAGASTSRPTSPSSDPSRRSEPQGLAAQIAAAHGGDLYAKKAVFADLSVDFGGQTILAGKLVFEPGTKRCRIETAEGGVCTFDGTDAWTAGMPAQEGLPPARFHLLTWPWFLSSPWKLGDPGSKMAEQQPRSLRGREVPSAKMTFEPGVGDTPDDWYIVYADPESHVLAAVAYIITFGKSVEEANKEPHAATYDEFVVVEGLRMPKVLTFWNWNEADGLVGDPIGELTVSNVRFGAADEATFAKPEGAKKG